MIVDGKAIASLLYTDLVKRVSDLGAPPRLTVFTCAPDLETRTYLKFKKEKAEMIGVTAEIIECAEGETTESLIEHIDTVAESTDGIIVQLPLPAHIDTDRVLASVPITHDV
ncbi:MAG: tetrahydrofolate dehydrogenase/cyclohydrolase catalytic domain-containing protein, partial [Candidatus Paceibacterota bacterium]